VKGNENGRYLVCANYVRGHKCTEGRRHFRYEPLEAAVLDHVKEVDLAEALQGMRQNEDQRQIEDSIATLTLQLEELRRKEQRLAEAVEDDHQPPDAIVALLRSRQSERKAVEAQLQHQKAEYQRQLIRRDDPADRSDRIARLRAAWSQATGAMRYELRSEAHAAIRDVVRELSFDSEEQSATLIVGNGVRAYRLRDGKLVSAFDAFAVAAE